MLHGSWQEHIIQRAHHTSTGTITKDGSGSTTLLYHQDVHAFKDSDILCQRVVVPKPKEGAALRMLLFRGELGCMHMHPH
jgi:hypothetical protein